MTRIHSRARCVIDGKIHVSPVSPSVTAYTAVESTRIGELERVLTVSFGAHASVQAPRMLELVLVRHGQSEGNVAYRRSLAGDHSLYSGKHHSSEDASQDRGAK